MQADTLGDPLGVLDGGVGHHDHELLAAIAARQIDGADIGSQAHSKLSQHLVADVVAVAVVDLLEVVDVDQQAGDRVAAVGRPLHQGLKLPVHVAAIVQAGQLVGDSQLQRVVEIVAQIVGVALAADLGAGAGRQLLRVDRLGQDVVDPDLQGLHQARPLVEIDNGQDRQVPRRLVRPELGGETQAVERAGRGVDDDQVHQALGGHQGDFGIALDHRPMLDGQLRGDALGLALMIIDDQHPAPRAAQTRRRPGDHAHAAAGGLAVAKFVDHHLQAGQAAHAREQHHVVDGLSEEFVGAGLKARDTVAAAVQGGDQHHRHVPGLRIVLQPAADLKAVHAGHHHVQQDDVGLFAGGDGQRRRSVVRRQDVVIFGGQLGFEQADIGLDIIDDENARGHDG